MKKQLNLNNQPENLYFIEHKSCNNNNNNNPSYFPDTSLLFNNINYTSLLSINKI